MYQPKDMDEITVFFDYSPAEYEREHQVVPADIEILHLEINGDVVGDALEDHLIETFGDQWCQEIIRKTENRRAA